MLMGLPHWNLDDVGTNAPRQLVGESVGGVILATVLHPLLCDPSAPWMTEEDKPEAKKSNVWKRMTLSPKFERAARQIEKEHPEEREAKIQKISTDTKFEGASNAGGELGSESESELGRESVQGAQSKRGQDSQHIRRCIRMCARMVILQSPSTNTSTQEWLPELSVQRGVPTKRAGIPHARQAATSRIESPVHDASLQSSDSYGLWSALGRAVE